MHVSKSIQFLLFISLCSFRLYSQSIRTPLSARYIGLGAYSTMHVDVFSFTANQAALARVKNFAAGVYGERRFMLSAINMYTMAVVIPTPKGNFGIEADYFGYKYYNESQIGFAYARGLGPKLDVGVKFNYYGMRIPGYTNSSAFNFEIGAIAHLSAKLHAGIHIYNPVGGKLSKGVGEKLGSAYKFGIGYEASEIFFVSTEISKEEGQVINVTTGFQYNFEQLFFVRAGIATETTSTYAGAGIAWKNLRLDVSGSYHPQLGFSPGLMLITNITHKE